MEKIQYLFVEALAARLIVKIAINLAKYSLQKFVVLIEFFQIEFSNKVKLLCFSFRKYHQHLSINCKRSNQKLILSFGPILLA